MAELRYTYLLDVKDRASRQIRAANEQIARSVTVANRAMEKQGVVAASASRKVATSGARQAAEWKQVARAAQAAERSVAQAATQGSVKVSRAMERQIAAQRKAGASYAQIARQQKAAGASAAQTAAAIEQSAAREQRAINSRVAGVAKTGRATSALRRQISDVKGLAGGLIATFGVLKGVEFVGDSVRDVEQLARATVKLTAITGQDATTASSWIQIAKERGISAQQLARGFVTLEKNQVKAAAGSKVQAEAFRSLGISQEELKKSNPQQLILKVADGMKNMESPAKRAAAAQALFGRAGVSLIATLSGGSQSIRDHLKVVQEYGASLDKNGVKQAMKLVAEQRKLKLAMDGVKISLGQALVPILARGAAALSKFVLQMRQGTGTGGQVRRIFEQMAQGAKGVWSAVGPAVKALAAFAKQHPGLVKVAGAVVAVGVAFRALRFASAISGLTTIGKLLVGLGRTRAGAAVVSAVARPIGGLAAKLAGPVAAAGKAVLGLGGYGVRAGASAVKSIVVRVAALAAKLAAPLAAAGGKIIDAIGGAGVTGGAHARDSILKRVQGIRPKASGRLLGAFRGLGVALGAAAGLAISQQIAKAIGARTGGQEKVNRATGDPGQSVTDWVRDNIPGAKTLDDLFGSHRRGGIVSRRYQAGGLVPAMVSPGEMIVHGNRAGMVPGAPVAADNVAMMLPVGAAVLTGDGQRMVSQGATVGQAIRRQAPHFATGGWVRTGATVYNDPPRGAFGGSLAGGYAELGTATRSGAGTGRGYIARALGMRGELPANFALDVKIHGRTKTLRKRDRGFGQGTPAYSIDIWKDSWGAFGINSSFKGPALIRPASGRLPASASSTGGRPGYSTYQPRGRLITSGRAMQLGYQAGLEGGSLYPVYASVRDAVTYNRTDHPAVAGTPRGGGGGGGGAGRGPDYGGRTGPMVTFQGKRMRAWLAHALAYARDKGWRGHVVEGLRSIAEQRRLWNGAPGNGLIRGVSVARPGTSNHQTGNAVDVAPAGPGLLRYLRGYRGHKPQWRGPTDRPHYSWNGHRRGGIIGARRFQGGGLVGPGNAVAPRDPLPRYQPGMPMTTGPSVVGPATLQSTRGALGRLVGVEMTAYQKTVRMVAAAQRALLKAGAHDNQAIATALHAIDVGIQRVHQVSYGRLEKMAKQLKSAIATTKDPDTSRRLKAELRLVFGEMGRRIGLLAKEAADMVDPAVRAAVHVERILKASKGRIDMTTGAALSKLEKSTQVGEDQLRAAIAKLQEAYRRAQKAGLKGAMHDLAGRIADLMGQLTQVMRDAKDAAQQAIADAIQAASDATAAARDRAARSFAAGQTIAGVDSASPEGLLAQYRFAGQQQQDLQADLAKLQEMRKWAAGSGNAAAVAQIDEAAREQQVKIQEGLANMADLAGRGQEAVNDKIRTFVEAVQTQQQEAADRAEQAAQDAADRREAQRQAAIDAATGAVALAQGGLQGLGLQQQLAGTYEGGGQARADYITSTIVPAIQREIETLRRNGASAQDIQQAQNDLLQAQLDAQDAIKQNTGDTADALSKLGGSLAFEFQGARLTDDLIASGVGA